MEIMGIHKPRNLQSYLWGNGKLQRFAIKAPKEQVCLFQTLYRPKSLSLTLSLSLSEIGSVLEKRLLNQFIHTKKQLILQGKKAPFLTSKRGFLRSLSLSRSIPL
jgi:hypothetical protein